MARPPSPPPLPPLNLTDIVARVRRERRWSAATAKKAELWYRRFLLLVYLGGGKPVDVISKKSDYVWHAHILFTVRYQADCKRIFGYYLEHTPSAGGSAKLRKARMASGKALYKKTFGAFPPWPDMPCYHHPH